MSGYLHTCIISRFDPSCSVCPIVCHCLGLGMGSNPMILARPPDLGSGTWDPKVLAMKSNG
jgi:hypothetical protein